MPITINGSGAISGLASASIQNSQLGTGVVAQNNLAGNVAGNGPVVLVTQTSNQQTFTSSVLSKVICDTKAADTHNAYNTTTGVFQPSVAGYYTITCRVETANRGGSETYETLKKNGSEYARLVDITTTAWWGTPYTVLVYMNGTTDYVEHYMFHSTGSNKTTTLSAGYLTYFHAALVRTA